MSPPSVLASEAFRLRVQRMNVSLLAVDEAHCISQWGYDFRPSYLRIAEIRRLIPDAPVLALTASATTLVAEDIMERLGFAEPNILRSSSRARISRTPCGIRMTRANSCCAWSKVSKGRG